MFTGGGGKNYTYATGSKLTHVDFLSSCIGFMALYEFSLGEVALKINEVRR